MEKVKLEKVAGGW